MPVGMDGWMDGLNSFLAMGHLLVLSIIKRYYISYKWPVKAAICEERKEEREIERNKGSK